MQGYIIDLKSVKDEDLIVTILAQHNVHTTYRFYGARHSNINVGYKIDFEIESNLKSTISRLKDVIQLGFEWIFDREKLYCWQRFLKLFYSHLKDVDEIDEFYFLLLEDLALKINKQNPKRAIIESYIKLLDHEGRLHTEYECLICEQTIDQNISLVRAFHPTHSKCTYSKKFKFSKVQKLFEDASSIDFSDEEVDYLWNILLQGI